jgi:hypothetical protein
MGTANVTLPQQIILRDLKLNSTSNTINLNCQQVVVLENIYTAGNIDLTPLATYGVMPVYDRGTSFLSSAAFTGTGVTSYLIGIGGVKNNLTIRDSALLNLNLKNTEYYSGTVTLTNAGATPSISGGTIINITNGSAQTITGFTNPPADGTIIYVFFKDGNSTLSHTGQFILQGSVNVTPTNDSNMEFMVASNGTLFRETGRTIV